MLSSAELKEEFINFDFYNKSTDGLSLRYGRKLAKKLGLEDAFGNLENYGVEKKEIDDEIIYDELYAWYKSEYPKYHLNEEIKETLQSQDENKKDNINYSNRNVSSSRSILSSANANLQSFKHQLKLASAGNTLG